MIEVYFLTGLGLVMTASILLVSALNQELGFYYIAENLGLFAILLYSIGLLLLLIDSVRHFQAKRYSHGIAVLFAAISLFCCSLLPIYGRHQGVPNALGGGFHRHIFWEFGHVH